MTTREASGVADQERVGIERVRPHSGNSVRNS